MHGIVQGVGYRAFIKDLADKYRINGYVQNMEDGSVEILILGIDNLVEKFIDSIDIYKNYGIQVYNIEELPLPDNIDKFKDTFIIKR